MFCYLQIIPGETTHLVAARPGTAKVNEARRAGTGIHLVSPEWLACTAERWERAEERLFPLSRTSKRGNNFLTSIYLDCNLPNILL